MEGRAPAARGGESCADERKTLGVEVDVSSGLPALAIAGLADASEQDAKERVRAAVMNSHREVPARRILVNLAPADIRKEGAAYDLPIALGLLLATG